MQASSSPTLRPSSNPNGPLRRKDWAPGDVVTPEHLEILKDVYGPDPMKPGGIYGIGRHKEAAQSE
jgi:hypothetical protein